MQGSKYPIIEYLNLRSGTSRSAAVGEVHDH